MNKIEPTITDIDVEGRPQFADPELGDYEVALENLREDPEIGSIDED